jgi:hypothetical protein
MNNDFATERKKVRAAIIDQQGKFKSFGKMFNKRLKKMFDNEDKMFDTQAKRFNSENKMFDRKDNMFDTDNEMDHKLAKIG